MNTKKVTRYATSLGLAAFATGLSAQSLEEVIVTAQKRSASLQDVPVSMTAITGQVSRELGWETGADALNQVPNVQMDPGNARTNPQFRIRGVGSEDFNVAGQSPVGVYINEVYINNNRSRGVALFDLDRVEVLRGPQGTLWGKNTTAGAIHFVTQRPTFETGGYGLMRVGSIDGEGTTSTFEGALGGSLIDQVLAGRLAVKVENGEDWIKNEHPNGEDLGEYDGVSVRGSLLWSPTDRFDATLIASYSDFNGDPQNQHALETNLYGYTEPRSLGFDTNQESNKLWNDSDVTNLTLTMEWRLGDWTVNSITGYNSVDASLRIDDDYSPIESVFWQSPGEADQFSQELRLTSSAEKRLRWIFGAYMFSEDLKSEYDLNFSLVPFDPTGEDDFSVAHIFGQEAPPANAESLVVKSFEDRERDSYAFFVSAEFDVTDSVTLSGGLRWTRDEESIDLKLLNYWLDDYAPVSYGKPSTALTGVLTVFDADEDTSWKEPTGDITVKWRISDDLMTYARYARGYRAGQYNITNTDPSDFSLVDPEYIDAYELGFKATLLDGLMRLNGSVYTYDYSDVQVYIFTEAGSVALLNGDDAEMKGGELELSVAPLENLFISAGVGYTDGTYGRFVSDAYNRTGNRIASTPEWTANLLARYTLPLGSGAALDFQTDWDYKDNFYASADNLPIGYSGQRTLGNAMISYRSANDSWVVRGWVKNLTNDEYNTGIQLHPVATRAAYGLPRSYGLTLETNF